MYIKKRLLTLTLILSLPLIVAACDANNHTAEGYNNATLAQAYEGWQKSSDSAADIAFLDVRTAREFAAGHVPGAINIPIQELAQRLNEVPANKYLFVHCEAGVRSAKAADLLMGAGIHDFDNIPAGMRGWRKAGYPVAK
ncbi:MAG: rhodanese-like domain-containing protein [Mariprofundus sp.]|nr:rhodanese-like domain-containing protein [Mariprofundus sp.]